MTTETEIDARAAEAEYAAAVAVAAAREPAKQLSCDNELLEPGSCEVCSSDIRQGGSS